MKKVFVGILIALAVAAFGGAVASAGCGTNGVPCPTDSAIVNPSK
jgi:hypothetical protein